MGRVNDLDQKLEASRELVPKFICDRIAWPESSGMDILALIFSLVVFKSGPVTIETNIVDLSFTQYPLSHKVTVRVAVW